MKVKCPKCGGESSLGKENPFRPFCSERCKLIDLGHWISEDYRVSAQADGETEGVPPSNPSTDKPPS